MLLTLVLSLLTCVSCSEETLDYNNPDVDLFVRQLKAGNYNTKSPKGFGRPGDWRGRDMLASEVALHVFQQRE